MKKEPTQFEKECQKLPEIKTIRRLETLNVQDWLIPIVELIKRTDRTQRELWIKEIEKQKATIFSNSIWLNMRNLINTPEKIPDRIQNAFNNEQSQKKATEKAHIETNQNKQETIDAINKILQGFKKADSNTQILTAKLYNVASAGKLEHPILKLAQAVDHIKNDKYMITICSDSIDDGTFGRDNWKFFKFYIADALKTGSEVFGIIVRRFEKEKSHLTGHPYKTIAGIKCTPTAIIALSREHTRNCMWTYSNRTPVPEAKREKDLIFAEILDIFPEWENIINFSNANKPQ